jgi:hypothetical protein
LYFLFRGILLSLFRPLRAQGVLLSQYRFDEMRLRGVRLANKGGDELAFPLKQCRHLDAYAHQLDRYNATLDELEYTTENRLILHAFRYGCSAHSLLLGF